MSDNKNKRKPVDASILDYYRRINNADPAYQTVGAAVDLIKNYMDMIADGTKEGDKYFHCKGNCEATRRGPVGEFMSTIMSDAREYVQS